MKVFTGKVISTKMAKTATVAVTRVYVHPIYKKRFRKIRKYQVHDELGTVVGQEVKFTATRPVSKLKKWKIIEIVQIKQDKKKTKDETKIEAKTKEKSK